MLANLVFIFLICGSLEVAECSSKHICKRENNVTVTCNFVPVSITEGVIYVHLFLEIINDTTLDENTFPSRVWNKVEMLELRAVSPNWRRIILQDRCFTGLQRLQKLSLHVTCDLDIHPNTFLGLENVETLDMDGCLRFPMNKLTPALRGSKKLPGLSILVLSNISLFRGKCVVDDNFVQSLESKMISYLDVSRTRISYFSITAVCKRLKYLKVINASYSTLEDFHYKYLTSDDLKHKSIDISHIVMLGNILMTSVGKIALSNFSVNISNVTNLKNFQLFFMAETVNISGLIPHTTSIWTQNCEVKLDRNPNLLTKEIIVGKNNLRRLDVKLKCEQFQLSSFERVDLSDNGLQFIHPDFLSCLPNLQKIDLSANELVEMARESTVLLEKLFSSLKVLKSINLSSNRLKGIPMNMFENNGQLEEINLSGNRLELVHFVLTGLRKLHVLDLQGNNIHTLDQRSMHTLNSIPNRNTSGSSVGVILNNNPLSCSKCETKAFLSWLVSTNLISVPSQILMCSNENGLQKHINKNILDEVEKICERKIIIVTTSVSSGVIVLILLLGLLTFYSQRKKKSKIQKRVSVINLLRKGEGCHEFAVFLAFSNEDEDFVNRYILNPLNENLQLMAGVDRELVCTGDRHFRPGFYVHNETYRQLDTAAVMIVIASNNFCRSDFCRNELDEAYVMKKPIVLMFIEHIDQEEMIPTMKELYQRNVRILWTLENGEYKMKTTWENVCMSILDLINV